MAKESTKKEAAASTNKKSGVVPASVRKQLVLGALVAEMLGTAMLTFAALMSGNNPVVVALAVVVGVLVFSELSGGHINPVVTVAAWVSRRMTWVKALGYIVAQVIGAMIAYVIVAKFMKSGDAAMSGSVYTLFTDPSQAAAGYQTRAPGQWKPIFGEFVGAIIFGFGIASVLFGKKEGFERAFTIGGALLIGLVAALAGSYAVLNPAVATALSGFAQGGWWSIGAYAIAPLAGGGLGAGLYRLLKSDVDATAKS